LEGNNYTLFSENPILGEDHQSKVWVLHVNKYIPSRVEKSWQDGQSWMRPGELSDLLSELKVGGLVPHH
jgi:hypothetical protein